MPISVQTILPENQYNKDVTYFDLLMEPKKKQTLKIVVYNSSSSNEKIKVQLNSAMTNSNGLIDYTLDQGKKKYDSSLSYPFTTLAKSDEEVEIPAEGKKEISVDVQMPEQSYDGIILGGISISKINEQQEDEGKKKGNMEIETNIEYSIGVVLREGEQNILPDLKLINVKADQSMGMNVIKINLQNPTSTIIDDISYVANIYKENSKEILYTKEVTGYRMAPNTNFNYEVDLGSESFKSGIYYLELFAEGKSMSNEEKKWHFTKNFKISNKEAKRLNKQAVNINQSKFNWLYVMIVGLVIIILVVLLIKRKQKRQVKNKLRVKKRIKK